MLLVVLTALWHSDGEMEALQLPKERGLDFVRPAVCDVCSGSFGWLLTPPCGVMLGPCVPGAAAENPAEHRAAPIMALSCPFCLPWSWLTWAALIRFLLPKFRSGSGEDTLQQGTEPLSQSKR